MNRSSLSIVVGLVAVGSFSVALSSCNAPECGPGTVQQQQGDGKLKCVLVDVPVQDTKCDTDGGNVVIVGGHCVSAIQCDPGTTMNVNGICVGTGTSMGASCSTPTAGKACISGSILNFKDNKKSTTPIHVDLYDPVTLLNGGLPIASYDSVDGGSYVFQNFSPPSLGLVVVATGRTTAGFVVAGSAGQNIGASKYVIDTYALPAADAAMWGGGIDIATTGAFVAKFYKDPAPAAGAPSLANETMPVAGVTLTKDGAAAAGVKYFNDTLTAVDNALTVTGNSGAAVIAAPVSGSGFPTFSGTGPAGMPTTGPGSWEQHPGGSAPGLVLILRFHPI
jgi:hypothetical protein